MFSNLLKEVSAIVHKFYISFIRVSLQFFLQRPLAISGTFALFGYNVQLVASDMPGIVKKKILINIISSKASCVFSS